MARDDEIARELAQLRRGHGVHAPDMLTRVGPHLRGICGIGPATPHGEARRRLVDNISAAVTDLPPDLCLAVQAAFGLAPASQSRFLRERMVWLGQEIQRDPRTATRRVESGLALLAERLGRSIEGEGDRGSEFAPEGWYVDVLRATLSMHVDPVGLLETRRITATVDGLDRITTSWSVPPVSDDRRPGPLRVAMIYGGELVKDEAISTPTYWSGWICLPHALKKDEQHEYQVQVTSLPRTMLRPYYVLSPMRRFDEFELRAKFDPATAPEQIWQLNGVPFRLVDEHRPIGPTLVPDAVGEVVSRFQNLRQGLSYGLQWRDRASGGSTA